MSIQIENLFDFPQCLLSKYKPLDLIGRGAYGEVWKALHMQNNILVAVKVFKSLFVDCVDSKRILREIYLLKRMKHPNIIQVLDICVENLTNFQSVYVILEYMPYNLSQSMTVLKNVNVKVIYKIIYQLLKVLSYLKKKNIMHRDIKPCNILIDDSFNVKVCDFGISRNIVRKRENSFDNFSNLSATSFKQLRENRLVDITNLPSYFFSIAKYNDNIEKKQMQPLTHRIGTRWYRAPELILLNNMYDEKIDIWATGCVVAEMIGCLDSKYFQGVLFPGNFCYPLSPCIRRNQSDMSMMEENEEIILDPADQINLILEILGTPDPESLKFIENQSARKFLKNFGEKKKIEWKRLFPGAEESLFQILDATLQFSPDKRKNADEILSLKCFEIFKNDPDLHLGVNYQKKIRNLDFQDIIIDFDTNKFHLDQNDLLLLFSREISSYQNGWNPALQEHVNALMEAIKITD